MMMRFKNQYQTPSSQAPFTSSDTASAFLHMMLTYSKKLCEGLDNKGIKTKASLRKQSHLSALSQEQNRKACRLSHASRAQQNNNTRSLRKRKGSQGPACFRSAPVSQSLLAFTAVLQEVCLSHPPFVSFLPPSPRWALASASHTTEHFPAFQRAARETQTHIFTELPAKCAVYPQGPCLPKYSPEKRQRVMCLAVRQYNDPQEKSPPKAFHTRLAVKTGRSDAR